MSLIRCLSVAVLLASTLPAAAATEPPPPPGTSPAAAAAPAAAATSANDAALREQVRGLVRQAGESVDRGDRAHAVQLLEQARRLRPDPTLDYNLGITYAEMSQGTEAAHALGRFLVAADPTRVLPERLADARKRMAEYERQLGRLRVRVSSGNVASALHLDDRPTTIALQNGSLPRELDPLWVQPGVHRVRVTAPGLRDYQVAVDVAAGESRELTGDLYKDDVAAVGLLRDPPPTTSKEPQPFYKKWWFWTAVGAGTVTIVGFIAAGASGAFTSTAKGSDLDSVDLPGSVGGGK